MSTITRTEAATTAVAPGTPFSDVIYVVTADALTEEGPGRMIYSFTALFGYALLHPVEFARWTADQVAHCKRSLPTAHVIKRNVVYWSVVAHNFLFSPPRRPEDHARCAIMASRKGKSVIKPLEEGSVRVKWYPDVEATLKWPVEVGELWMDVLLEPNGDLDLRSVMRQWGMENCYLIDANRGRPQLSRYPAERLTALAVAILLDGGHSVIGVVECPTPHMQDARKGRTYVVEALPNAKRLSRDVLKTVPDALQYLMETGPAFLGMVGFAVFQFIAFTVAGNAVLLAYGVREASAFVVTHLAMFFDWMWGSILIPWARDLRYVSEEVFIPVLVDLLADFLRLLKAVMNLLRAMTGLLKASIYPISWFVHVCWSWTLAALEASFLTEEEVEKLELYRRLREVVLDDSEGMRESCE